MKIIDSILAGFMFYVILAATYAIGTWWTNPQYQKDIPFPAFMLCGSLLILYWLYMFHIVYCAKRGRRSFLAPPRQRER